MTANFWPVLLAGWFAMGMAYAATLTPSGLLLRRSAQAEDRPAVFAAQFALSHSCWLIAYPLAGVAGADFGQQVAFILLAGLAVAGCLLALLFWPARSDEPVAHDHADLPHDHPHLAGDRDAEGKHTHPRLYDELHSYQETGRGG